MSEDFAQIRLAPLLRVEALYLLGDTSIGFVVFAKEGMTARQAGFHAVERGELVILTVMTAELETMLEDGQPITYLAESTDHSTGRGWYATFTGPAELTIDSAQRLRYQQPVPGFDTGNGARVLRLRPQLVDGHRFQRLVKHQVTARSARRRRWDEAEPKPRQRKSPAS